MPVLLGRTAREFIDFIADKKIQVISEDAQLRAEVGKGLSNLGAKSAFMALSSDWTAALQDFVRLKPAIVICDYTFCGAQGLNLVQELRKAVEDSADAGLLTVIMLVESKAQMATSLGAEDDVDGIVQVPFTSETLRQGVGGGAGLRYFPDDFRKVLVAGRQSLKEGRLDEALQQFQKAAELQPRSALALYHVGQVLYLKGDTQGASDRYSAGLALNKIHLRCLTGLHECLWQKSAHAEAYDVAKRVFRYYPVTAQRLVSAVRLAVVTRSVDDIEAYAQAYRGLTVKTEETTRYMCAAMVVCGKYYLQKNLSSRAFELFLRTAEMAGDRSKVFREIVLALLDANLVSEARKFLEQFPPKARTTPDFQLSEYLILDRVGNNFRSIDQGRKLIKEGIDDPLVYRVLLQRTFEAGMSDSVKVLLDEAQRKWPDRSDEFAAVASGQMKKPATR